MNDKYLSQKYAELLREVVNKYKGQSFFYTPPCSSADEEFSLVGCSDNRLIFKDNRGKNFPIGLDTFLDSMGNAQNSPSWQPPTKVMHPRDPHMDAYD